MARCPDAIWRPVNSHGGLMDANIGLVLHVQAGTGSPYGWFSNGANQASSTFWVAYDGTLEQYGDSAIRMWAQALGNSTYCSVETEGQPEQALTDAQVRTLGRLYAWGHAVHGWPFAVADHPGQPGFIWHGAGGANWGGHIYCPGDLRKAQRPQILALAQGASPPPEDDDVLTPEESTALKNVDAHMANVDNNMVNLVSGIKQLVDGVNQLVAIEAQAPKPAAAPRRLKPPAK